MEELTAQVLRGEVRAAARVCRRVDDRASGFRTLLKELYPHAQAASWIGVTGQPGAGKSTLVAGLIRHYRDQGKRVGVVAIDPTSPFSGGAILGDRIRMQEHFEDPEVFIRSLATRGALGGLSRSACDVARVLSAWGAEIVLLETVGVGQDELEVAFVADTTLVVLAPGMGDAVQAMKAGILECADVFALNKSDLAGADSTLRDLEQMLSLNSEDPWRPIVVSCTATRGQGISELVSALTLHHVWQRTTPAGQEAQRARSRRMLLSYLTDEVLRVVAEERTEELEALVTRVQAGALDPYSACDELLAGLRSQA